MESQAITIRVAVSGDVEALLRLQKKAFAQEARDNGVADIPPLTQTLESFEEEFARHTVLVAEVDGRLVGMGRGREQEGVCSIGRLAVEPAMQGKGIGRRLLSELESRFPSANRFELFTGAKSLRNIRLYEKAGYKVFRTEVGEPSLVYMERIRE
jgi:ribosomal protein S18 acetylase RimI-like enzyme